MADNVLLIDDSTFDRRIIRALLERRFDDLAIHEIAHGNDAVPELLAKDIQVCILDIVMPGKDGYQVLADIKANPDTADVPVIVCTGLEDVSGIEKALTLGALDYFSKPLNEEVIKVSLPLKVKNAIEFRRRQKQVWYLSYHDKLTGLYNRHFFDEELKRLDTDRQLPCSIIMGDLNGLKITNDVFGHAAGDELLVAAADALREACRDEDIIARWGGDEFVILLPQTSENGVQIVCQRIRTACADRLVDDRQVNMSLGFATKAKDSELGFDVVKQAEKAMYKEKLTASRRYQAQLADSLVKRAMANGYVAVGHSSLLDSLSSRFADALGLTTEEREMLGRLIGVYDVGKLALSRDLLEKETALTKVERLEIRRHAEVGYRIAEASSTLASLSEYILHHHEHWNGEGYPSGLTGEEIPKLSRVVAVLDAYDAMRQERPFRPGKSHMEAINEIITGAYTQFDPSMAKVFAETFQDHPPS